MQHNKKREVVVDSNLKLNCIAKTMMSQVTIMLLLVASSIGGASGFLVQSNSTCVCTTVACPKQGKNTLTEGGGSQGVYYYSDHAGHAVVTSASVTITKSDLDKGSDTTSCTQEYSRTLDDDGYQIACTYLMS
jgi:hypothetical protein